MNAAAQPTPAALVESVRPWVHKLAHKARHRDAVYSAEDLAQDILLRCLRYAPTYKPERAKPSTWAAMIARTNIPRFTKAGNRGGGLSLDDMENPPEETVPPNVLALIDGEEGAKLRNLIGRAIAELPEDEFAMIAARYLGGREVLPYTVVAEQMGVSVGTVTRIERRALERIREFILEASDDFDDLIDQYDRQRAAEAVA